MKHKYNLVAVKFFRMCIEPTNISTYHIDEKKQHKQENVAHLFSGFGHSTLITNHLMNDKCAEISDTQVNDYITSCKV